MGVFVGLLIFAATTGGCRDDDDAPAAEPTLSPQEQQIVQDAVRRLTEDAQRQMQAATPAPIPTTPAAPAGQVAPAAPAGQIAPQSTPVATVTISPVFRTTPRPAVTPYRFDSPRIDSDHDGVMDAYDRETADPYNDSDTDGVDNFSDDEPSDEFE
jgi:hypothetical protein